MSKSKKKKWLKNREYFDPLGFKHDLIILSLEKRLSESFVGYSKIQKEDKYYNSEHVCLGECDLYALYYSGTNQYLLCFEVKANHKHTNKQKAVHQLFRDVDHYSKIYHPDRVFKFYVHSEGNDHYKVNWVTSRSSDFQLDNHQ
jgi:hypothetical protein